MAPDAIVRAPLPEPIPRRLPGRLRFFEALWCQFADDARATLDELRADGWSEESARECLDGYVRWVAGNVQHAVELALFIDELEAAA